MDPVQALRERQGRWMRERQNEMERESVVAELTPDALSSTGGLGAERLRLAGNVRRGMLHRAVS